MSKKSAASDQETQANFLFPGFEPANTTPVPDVFFDELLPRLNEAQIKTMLYIIRRTLGFKKSSDAISLKQFRNGITKRTGEQLDHGCGLKNMTTIIKALTSLEAMGCIESEKVKTEEGDSATTVYRIRFSRAGQHSGGTAPNVLPTAPSVVPGTAPNGGRGTAPNVVTRNSNTRNSNTKEESVSADTAPSSFSDGEEEKTYHSREQHWQAYLNERRGGPLRKSREVKAEEQSIRALVREFTDEQIAAIDKHLATEDWRYKKNPCAIGGEILLNESRPTWSLIKDKVQHSQQPTTQNGTGGTLSAKEETLRRNRELAAKYGINYGQSKVAAGLA